MITPVCHHDIHHHGGQSTSAKDKVGKDGGDAPGVNVFARPGRAYHQDVLCGFNKLLFESVMAPQSGQKWASNDKKCSTSGAGKKSQP